MDGDKFEGIGLIWLSGTIQLAGGEDYQLNSPFKNKNIEFIINHKRNL